MTTWALDNVLISDSEDEFDGDPLKRDWALGREAMLFVVDANLSACPERFQEALKTIRGAFISGLLVNDKDMLGVVFANTAKCKEPLESVGLSNISMPEHCSVFLPLRQLNKSIVQHFLDFVSTAEECFSDDYGVAPRNGCGSFAQMIRLCLSMFEHCGRQVNNATLVFLTDRDTPHPKRSNDWQMALLKAKDLEGKNVEFHVIPMVDDFDYNAFYAEFLTLAKDVELDSFVPPDPALLREKLTDRKLRQDFLRRTLGHITLSLGPGLELSTQYYNYFKRRSYPRKVQLLRADNSIVQQKRVIVVRRRDSETGDYVDEREVKAADGWYEINLGAMPIRISPAQMNRVRNLHQRGMMLLGFKPRSALPENFYYRPCNFMYPDEASIAGSKCLFRALWQRCLERHKIAVCLFMRKRNSIPRYVALVPVTAQKRAGAGTDSEEEMGEGTQQGGAVQALLSGDGFKVVFLPMAKQVRQIDFTDWNTPDNCAPDAGVQVMGKIIRKLRVDYEPQLINDPTLERLQAQILSLSLNIRTENDGVTDMPDGAMQDERIAAFLPAVDEIFGAEMPVKRSGRATADGGGGGDNGAPSKRMKIDGDGLKSLDYVKGLIAAQTIGTCTAAQLREILAEHCQLTLAKSATKPVLLERVLTEVGAL